MQVQTVAYLTSRFPKISETFVLDELNSATDLGLDVTFFPLRRERTSITHPTAAEWCETATFVPLISGRVVADNIGTAVRSPRRYFSTLAKVLGGTAPSRRFLAGAVAYWLKMVSIARAIERSGATHIHCHFASHPALAGYVATRLTGIPFSFTGHGSDLHRDQTMLGQKVAAAAFVRTISADNQRLIRECSNPADYEKVHMIHCGVDISAFGTSAPRTNDPCHILCIGTLHEVKGQKYLIEALGRFQARGGNFRCTFVGDGPDRTALQQLVDDLGLTGDVELVGTKTRPQVIELLSQVDLLVAPSVPSSDGRREGIPVVLIEAMAAGLPVVSSRLSGIPELVADNDSGLLVEPRDVDALAEAIGQLLEDEELRIRLGKAGREIVETDFNLKTNTMVLAELFGRWQC